MHSQQNIKISLVQTYSAQLDDKIVAYRVLNSANFELLLAKFKN